MHWKRLITIVIATGGIGLGCLLQLGCGADETKTTGTQLQLTPKDKADIEEMRGAMKGQREALKQEKAEDKKQGK